MYQEKGMEGEASYSDNCGGGHFSITELTHHTACHLPPDVTILRLHCSSESFSPLPKRLVLRMERNVEIFGPSDGCTRPESEPGGSSFCSLAATTLWPTVFLGGKPQVPAWESSLCCRWHTSSLTVQGSELYQNAVPSLQYLHCHPRILRFRQCLAGV